MFIFFGNGYKWTENTYGLVYFYVSMKIYVMLTHKFVHEFMYVFIHSNTYIYLQTYLYTFVNVLCTYVIGVMVRDIVPREVSGSVGGVFGLVSQIGASVSGAGIYIHISESIAVQIYIHVCTLCTYIYELYICIYMGRSSA
jgi:hypothetical protein